MLRKKVVFCTYPSLYSSLVLTRLIASDKVDIVAVVASSRNLRATENKLRSDFSRIKTSGWRYACYLWLVTEAFSLFSRRLKYASIGDLCATHHIPVINTHNINTKPIRLDLANLSPDILLCAHFNQRVSPEIYDIAKDCSVNIHPSLLPDLKGVDPSFYALLDNYESTGVTLHQLAEDFDTGKTLYQSSIRVKHDDSLFLLNKTLFNAGVELFLQMVKAAKPINHAQTAAPLHASRYDSWPSKVQVSAFKKLKKSFITWKDIQDLRK